MRGKRRCATIQIFIRSIQFGLLAILFGAWWFIDPFHAALPLLLPRPELVWHADASPVVVGPALVGRRYYADGNRHRPMPIAAIAGIAVGFLVDALEEPGTIFEPVLTGIFAIPLTLFFPLFVCSSASGPIEGRLCRDLQLLSDRAQHHRGLLQRRRTLSARGARDGRSGLQQFRHVYLPARCRSCSRGCASASSSASPRCWAGKRSPPPPASASRSRSRPN